MSRLSCQSGPDPLPGHEQPAIRQIPATTTTLRGMRISVRTKSVSPVSSELTTLAHQLAVSDATTLPASYAKQQLTGHLTCRRRAAEDRASGLWGEHAARPLVACAVPPLSVGALVGVLLQYGQV